MRIVVLRAGDPPPTVAERRGPFFDWIKAAVGTAWAGEWSVVDVRTEDALPGVRDAAAFVMTGSSSNVTERAPWMLRAEAFLREVAAAETPFFGICFGHQMIAEALGGKVEKNPRGREIGTVDVSIIERDDIFDGFPDHFTANHTHMESVTVLPRGARLLAKTELEPHAAYAIGEHIKCVQFHPEFDGDVMRGYVEARAHLIEAEGRDPKPILAGAKDAPHGAATLVNFVRRLSSR